MECHTFMNTVMLKALNAKSMRHVSWDTLRTKGDDVLASFAPSYRAQLQQLAFAPAVVEKLKQIRTVEQRCGSSFADDVDMRALDPEVLSARFDRDFDASRQALKSELDALPVLPPGHYLGITTKLGLDTHTGTPAP